MALGLTVTDNLDGTADYAVTGTLAAAWSLAAGLWPSAPGPVAMVEQEAGTGDDADTITPTFASGPLIWTLTSGSQPPVTVYCPIAPTGFAPHLLAARYVLDGVKILGVADVAPTDIILRRLPRPVGKEHDRPMVIVSPFPTETEEARLSNKDNIVYPVTVAFFAPNNGGLNTNMERDFMSRWRVSKGFRNHRPAGVPGAAPLQIKWRPDLPTSPLAATANNLSVGAVIFEVGYRETRAAV